MKTDIIVRFSAVRDYPFISNDKIFVTVKYNFNKIKFKA